MGRINQLRLKGRGGWKAVPPLLWRGLGGDGRSGCMMGQVLSSINKKSLQICIKITVCGSACSRLSKWHAHSPCHNLRSWWGCGRCRYRTRTIIMLPVPAHVTVSERVHFSHVLSLLQLWHTPFWISPHICWIWWPHKRKESSLLERASDLILWKGQLWIYY